LKIMTAVLLRAIKLEPLRQIILGPRTDTAVKEIYGTRAKEWGVSLPELRIGARTYTPFFNSAGTPAAIWTGKEFEAVDRVCEACREPAELTDSGLCEWCSISDKAKRIGPM
jgi:hypothetical protein